MDNTLQDAIDKYLSRDLLFALHNREFLFDYFESMLTEFEDAPTEFYKYHDSFMDAIHVSITEHPNFRLFESLEDYGKHILEQYVRITSILKPSDILAQEGQVRMCLQTQVGL